MPRHPTNVWTNPHQYVTELISLVHDGPDPLGIYFTRREAFSQLASALAGAPTKAKAEIIRYFWRNMPKRAYPSSFNNGGFAKKSRYTKKYGGTGKKYVDKYKTGGRANIEAILHEAESRAKKTVLRTSETLYSQSGWYMDTSKNTFVQTGNNLSGLNTSAAFAQTNPGIRANSTNQVFVFPLSPMVQLGNQGTPGYRGGQKIQVHGLSISIMHYQNLPSTNGVYHYALVRNISKTITGTGYAIPGITQTNALSLFVPLKQGPLASAGGPNGVLPVGDFSSAMRWNRAEWRVCKSGTWTTGMRQQSQNNADNDDPTTAAGSGSFNNFTNSKILKIYYDFKDQTWDYTDPNSLNAIKGGDYYFMIWREGAADLYLGREQINGIVELSFKDP